MPDDDPDAMIVLCNVIHHAEFEPTFAVPAPALDVAYIESGLPGLFSTNSFQQASGKVPIFGTQNHFFHPRVRLARDLDEGNV